MLLELPLHTSQPSVIPEVRDKQNLIADVLKNRVLFFTGYPGSGKGTQGKLFGEKFHVVHLSTGELFREEVKRGTAIGAQMRAYMERGEVIPKELTFEYLKEELSKPQYRNGFILDGYPKNVESYEFLLQTLKDLQLEPLAAIHFEISREEVLERLTGRRHCEQCGLDFHILFKPSQVDAVCDRCTGSLEQRRDDSSAAIGKRLDVFEQNTGPVIQKFSDAGLLVKVDATKTLEAVYENLLSTISEISRREIEESGSYYLRIPQDAKRSATFHNHIDAKTHSILRSIVHKVEEASLGFQNKIYPVSHLELGPQVEDPEFASLYRDLPNFHPIDNALGEAFATGKMGEEGFNYNQVRETLTAAYQHPNEGVMTELEEEIFQMEWDAEGKEKNRVERGDTSYEIDWSLLPEWKDQRVLPIPRFELHHGFDIEKQENETLPPISLSELSGQTTDLGLQVGGWFIFRKKGFWSYRSNEFSNQDYTDALAKLQEQAGRLRTVVCKLLPNRQVTSGCSMEKVHAIWRVD